MAKEKNTTEVTGGITRSGILDGISFEPSAEPVVVRERAAFQQQSKNQLADVYRQQGRAERRSYKLNILVKPSTAQMMDKAVEEGEIKSRNDLINYLLEEYFKKK